jgi:hypothetical protein
VFCKIPAIGIGVAVVLGQDILFQLDQAGLAHAGDRGSRIARAIVMVMAMVRHSLMLVPMFSPMCVFHAVFDPGFTAPAAANRTHYETSSSLIRSSSPVLICKRWEPQDGQGSNRSLIAAVVSQAAQ